MSITTNLPGRLRNTSLPLYRNLLPMFEAVVNSIHAISQVADRIGPGQITVRLVREPRTALALGTAAKRGAPWQEPVMNFIITDTGIGFDDENFESFKELDTDHKAALGCRGVGRLSWLKAFERVEISSTYRDVSTGSLKHRDLRFSETHDVEELRCVEAFGAPLETTVSLIGFTKPYQDRAPKGVEPIAAQLLEHCLWYFVRPGGAPRITVTDGDETVDLWNMYEGLIHSSISRETMVIKGHAFELTHIKLNSSPSNEHNISWCAASRVVEEDNIAGKIAGLHGKVKDEGGDFVYACYITSPYLDERVRSERIGFDIPETDAELFSEADPSRQEIRDAVISAAKKQLDPYLQESRKAGYQRLQQYVDSQAPRYRPILKRLSDDQKAIDPGKSDKDVDGYLYEQWFNLEAQIRAESSNIMRFAKGETPEQYKARLVEFVSKISDMKQSDLAGYVSRRKMVLNMLSAAIERQPDGNYSREDVIHELIVPMRKTSDEYLFEDCNLWLIDERLAFHHYLASDRPLSQMPVLQNGTAKEPDIFILDVLDEPLLVAESDAPPLASITIIELKRPMRSDARAFEDSDPILQTLNYLQMVREGKVTTKSGRPIPGSDDIPGFCYVIADLTAQMKQCCKSHNLRPTRDNMGYWGYHDQLGAYIEVISFDQLVRMGNERNRAFFDKLGLTN